jgi:hypothetical protein
MNTIITDGGRSISNHPDERLDCTVRALAIATNRSYNDAHGILSQLGRKPKHKFYNTGEKITRIIGRSCKRSGSVGKFARLHPVGRFLIQVRGHCFALVNGEAYDMSPMSEKTHVVKAWSAQ